VYRIIRNTATIAAMVLTLGGLAAPAHAAEGTNYTGDAVTFYSFWPCTGSTADIDWKVPVMPAGWDNRISSFMNFNGCFTKHFDGASYTGLTTPGFSNDQPTMPGAAGPSLFNMDNRTSSLQFS